MIPPQSASEDSSDDMDGVSDVDAALVHEPIRSQGQVERHWITNVSIENLFCVLYDCLTIHDSIGFDPSHPCTHKTVSIQPLWSRTYLVDPILPILGPPSTILAMLI